MSRYTGPQRRGVSREHRDRRRQAAEERQATELERNGRRAATDAAPPPLLTDAERDALITRLEWAVRSRPNT